MSFEKSIPITPDKLTDKITYIRFDCPMCGTIMRKILTDDLETRAGIMDEWQEEHRKLHKDADAARQAKNFIEYLKGQE